nr:MAG TPA_asm: hypothetical protein [Caudoviricetes sp.]
MKSEFLLINQGFLDICSFLWYIKDAVFYSQTNILK